MIARQPRLVHVVLVLLSELVGFGGHINVNGVDAEIGDDKFHCAVVLTSLLLGDVTPNLCCNQKHPSSDAEVVHQLGRVVVPPFQNGIAKGGRLILIAAAVIVGTVFEMTEDTKWINVIYN